MNGKRKHDFYSAYEQSQRNKCAFQKRVKDGATPTERLHIYRQLVKENKKRSTIKRWWLFLKGLFSHVT